MKRRHSYKISNRKRRRQTSPNDINENESIIPSKKFKSEKTKKSQNLTLKEVDNFMACIDDEYSDKKFEECDKLTGDNLNFDCRKEKSINLIKGIENAKDKLNLIKESLEYDNTNKNIIYKLLEYYYNIKDEIHFKEAFDKYKFCITKKINIIKSGKEQIIDLNSFYTIDINIEEYEELANHDVNCSNINDIRNSIVDIYTGYYYISDYVYNLKELLSSDELKALLSCTYKNVGSQENPKYILNFEKNKKLEILSKYEQINKEYSKNILEKIDIFLCKYILYKEFSFFQLNQPIDYNNNLSLYYNYFIFYLYDTVVQVEQKNQKIILKESKLLLYYYLKKYHDLFFDNFFDKKIKFNKTMDHLIKYLLLLLSSERSNDYRFLMDYIHLESMDKFLNKEDTENLIGKIKEKDDSIKIKVDNDKIILEEKYKISTDTIEIKIGDYSASSLNHDYSEYNWMWEKYKFEHFQNQNFFLEKDLAYLKYLIKHILTSKLFKDIFYKYNNVSSVAEYYFNNPKNIDDYINRILFFPFSSAEFGKHGFTERKLLFIAASGFPEKRIHNLKQYRVYRIIELALRSIVLGDHEPCHYIKSSYSIITSGVIQRNTSNDNTLDSGFFMEEILFGWKAQENISLNIDLPGELICNNKSIKNKKIDLITALHVLNPSIYDSDLYNFRKIIFNASKEDLKTFSFNSITDNEYKKYLESIFDEKTIHELYEEEDYSINASMKSDRNMSVGYIRCNHNLGRTDNTL